MTDSGLKGLGPTKEIVQKHVIIWFISMSKCETSKLLDCQPFWTKLRNTIAVQG